VKSNIIFISGVKFDITPILKYSSVDLCDNSNVITIEYCHKKIFEFIFKSIYTILRTRNTTAIIFVGAQSLPLLFVIQLFYKNKLFYWALESYKFKFIKSPFVSKILIFEKFIYWKKINLIVPTKDRLEFYKKRKFKNTFIVSNCPPIGTKYKNREIIESEKIKLVIYGRLNNNDVYIKEFVDFCSQYSEKFELHIIGWDFELSDYISKFNNIIYHGFKDHKSLITMLDLFNYSVIGYRPYDYNNKYCAPNKLYEAFSQSLPVIVNKMNPPLDNFISSDNCGISLDFDNLNTEAYLEIVNKSKEYPLMNNKCYNLYLDSYNLSNELFKIKEYIYSN